ncbi:hypothetical protein WN51_06552 [Melipona quadrifasciata]|uniref:Uncharacterized protein n=1 Tax=Melipona quadrifasciata TaxID=166423 RepID=A0A0N0BCT6_9HYME|nr:hypothetical protein WN51_06552 [Melipona quadrifasciata]
MPASLLLDVHVPNDLEDHDTPEQRRIREAARLPPSTDDALPVLHRKIVTAFKSMRNVKDLIKVCALKVVSKVISGQLVRLFNGCLRWGDFEKDPKSYRPICLLFVIGKPFEKLIMSRLNWTSLAPERISSRQPSTIRLGKASKTFNKTLAKENANRADEIKELAHKLIIETYSASLVTSDSAPTMRSRRVAFDYQSKEEREEEEEEEIQEERIIYGTARDNSNFNETSQL